MSECLAVSPEADIVVLVGEMVLTGGDSAGARVPVKTGDSP